MARRQPPPEQAPGTLGVRMDLIQKERIQWRSYGRLAKGKVTFLDGDPGLGKSTLIADWAAKVSRGEALPYGQPQPERGVLLICGEDDPADTIRPRLEVMGADLEQITLWTEMPIYDEHDNPTDETRLVSFPKDALALEDIVLANDIGLVVIDPFTAFLDEDLKENSGQDMRRALMPIVKVLHRTGATAICIRHLNKSQSSNSLYRGTGSISIGGTARFVLLVAKHPKDQDKRVLALTKTNIGPNQPSLVYALESVEDEDVARVVWYGEIQMSADELLGDAMLTDEQRAVADEADLFLSDLLAKGPAKRDAIMAEAKKNGISSRAIDRAKARLDIKHTRLGNHLGLAGSFLVWHLPGTTVTDSHFQSQNGFVVTEKER